MANYTKFYTIAFEKKSGQVVDRSVSEFFQRLKELLKHNEGAIPRRINGKWMRVFKYSEHWELSHDILVVPIGRLKEKNIPFAANGIELKELDEKLYDVNSIVYHEQYNAAMLTTNQAGPTSTDMENYLNSFLDLDGDVFIRINPVMKVTGIEAIYHADMVRSVTFVLNVNERIGELFNKMSGDEGKEKSLSRFFKGFVTESKEELNNNTMQITMGVGRCRTESMERNSLLSLISLLNIDSDSVKEIYVNYKDDTADNVQTAQIKDDQIILKGQFKYDKNGKLSPEYLASNSKEVFYANHALFYKRVLSYWDNVLDDNGEYSICEEWNGGAVVV